MPNYLVVEEVAEMYYCCFKKERQRIIKTEIERINLTVSKFTIKTKLLQYTSNTWRTEKGIEGHTEGERDRHRNTDGQREAEKQRIALEYGKIDHPESPFNGDIYIAWVYRIHFRAHSEPNSFTFSISSWLALQSSVTWLSPRQIMLKSRGKSLTTNHNHWFIKFLCIKCVNFSSLLGFLVMSVWVRTAWKGAIKYTYQKIYQHLT